MKTNILIPIARETINHKVYPKQHTIDKLFTEKRRQYAKDWEKIMVQTKDMIRFIKELLHSF